MESDERSHIDDGRKESQKQKGVPHLPILSYCVGLFFLYNAHYPIYREGAEKPFRDSSMVEQLPVKELVVGSSPTRGADSITWYFLG